jgi:glycosyltransferase involved in cell wall biosynthesis
VPESTRARVIAVATRDPLDVGTFSGLSRNLFTALGERGIAVIALHTRDVRAVDLLSGAANLAGLARGQFRGRRAPKINPNWFWSRRASETMSDRFDERLRALGDGVARDPILQIGTHVRTRLPGRTSYCLTDATVVQAVRANEFSVARAGQRIIDEAIAWQGEVFQSCEKVFVLSQWAKASVVTDYGIADERVVVLGAGANVDERRPRDPELADPYILFVGADWQQKGGPLLLEAFRLVRAAVPAARLVVVGCRPELDEPGVEVLGTLSRRVPAERDRLFELYARAAIFSIVPVFDAFPNVLLEAAWYGVPVVSTDEGSRAEAVIDGVTGLLAPQRDAGQLAERMISLLKDPAYARRLGEAAAARVAERFTWSKVSLELGVQLGVLDEQERVIGS